MPLASPCSGAMLDSCLNDWLRSTSTAVNEPKPNLKVSSWRCPLSPVASGCDLAGMWGSNSDLGGLSDLSDDGGSSSTWGSPARQLSSMFPSSNEVDAPLEEEEDKVVIDDHRCATPTEELPFAQVSCVAGTSVSVRDDDDDDVTITGLSLVTNVSCAPHDALHDVSDDEYIQPSGRPPSPQPPLPTAPSLHSSTQHEPSAPVTARKNNPYTPALPSYHLKLAPAWMSPHGLHAASIASACMLSGCPSRPLFLPFSSDVFATHDNGCTNGFVVPMVVKQYASNEWLRHGSDAVNPLVCLNGCIAVAFEGTPQWKRPVVVGFSPRWHQNAHGTWFPSGLLFIDVWCPADLGCDWSRTVAAFASRMSHCFLMDRCGVWYDASCLALSAVQRHYKSSMSQDQRHKLTDGLPTGALTFEMAY